jgi:Fe-S cluster assembly iron-binding protein IscA
MSETLAPAAPFRLTEAAARRVAEILASDPDSKALRVEVLAGGCSGFQYKFDLTGAQNAEDLSIPPAWTCSPAPNSTIRTR